MALDNAQFMSELSITDPPGTDPLSEGDDQIRTSKRTQLQSFPNVDKAVTTTADQLNDVAIQSAFNIFTVQQTFQQDIILTAQLVSENDFVFNNSETGFRRWAFGRENTNAGGDWIVQRLDTAGQVIDSPFRIAESTGRSTFKAVVFMEGGTDLLDTTGSQQIALSWSDPTNSWSMISENTGANGLAASTFRMRRFINGAPTTDVFTVNNSNGEMTFLSSLLGRDASITNPTYAFSNNTDLGMFRSANNEMSFVSNGVIRMNLNPRSMNLGGIPLTNAGLASGDLFRSGGFVAIVP